MLADFLTMHESSNKPYDTIAYAFVGDCRFNMGRSLLIMGALMGSDVRLGGPKDLQPPKDIVDLAHHMLLGARAPRSPSPMTRAKPSTELTSSTPTCGCRWVNRKTSGPTASSADAVPGQPRAHQERRTLKVKFMHCLPAFHDPNTMVGREIMEHTGMTAWVSR